MVKADEHHFTVSVYLISDEKPKRILLILHNKFNNWMVPGGHIETDENPVQAVAREVKEETGLDVAPYIKTPEFLGDNNARYITVPDYVLEAAIPSFGDQPPHFHVDLSYVIHVPHNTPMPAKGESKHVRWYTAAELGGLDMFENVRQVAGQLLA